MRKIGKLIVVILVAIGLYSSFQYESGSVDIDSLINNDTTTEEVTTVGDDTTTTTESTVMELPEDSSTTVMPSEI